MSRWIAAATGAALLSCAIMARADADDANPIGRFEIVRFDVQGNTLLPGAVVDRLLAPFAGKARDFGSVQRALEALEAAYRQKGYSLVHVVLPEQELNHGVVQLRVIETRIGKITVTGNKHFDEANIRRSLPGLRVGESPNLADVSASLKLANENPSKKTTLQLKSGEQDDEVNAVLAVADEKPWTASIGVDNTGVGSTGRNHVTAQYQNANIGGLDHVMSLQYTTSLEHPNQVNIYGAGYHVPLYAQGDSFDLFGSHSDVNSGMVSAGLLNLAVSGAGTMLGARYNHNLKRVGAYDSKVIFGIDYKAFRNDISLAGTQLGNDITVHPLNLTYTGSWADSANAANFYASGLRNLPGGDKGGSADFDLARAAAPADYSILRYGASYTRALPRNWQLRLVLNGQLSRDALVPGEQFGAGGASSVRGFNEREVANDQGRTTNAEMYTPNLCAGTIQCRLLGFYDSAYLSRNNPLPGEEARQSIGSVGVGLRMNAARNLVLQLDAAQVADASDATPRGSHRLHFSMVFSY